MNYIDGFLAALPTANKAKYIGHAKVMNAPRLMPAM